MEEWGLPAVAAADKSEEEIDEPVDAAEPGVTAAEQPEVPETADATEPALTEVEVAEELEAEEEAQVVAEEVVEEQRAGEVKEETEEREEKDGSEHVAANATVAPVHWAVSTALTKMTMSASAPVPAAVVVQSSHGLAVGSA